ncbi:MAG: hypothetical protein RLZZ499_332, partial [Cyanobacteriota bacterium]
QILEVDVARQKNALWQVIRANQLREQTTQLETTKTEIMTVEENMKLLCQELQQASLYFNGSEVTADV